MALRALNIMKDIVHDMERLCPKARLVNYTNPINIVSQAVSMNTDLWNVSLCEGPIVFPKRIAEIADLDPDLVDAVMIGLNHGCWSVRHLYDGEDLIPILKAAYERKAAEKSVDHAKLRLLKLAVTMESLPAAYFQYYYFKDEILRELIEKRTTRSQDIIARVPDYWDHYREQSKREDPQLDPERSRGGIHELELAVDVLDAMFNDRGEVWPVNLVNNGAIPDFPDAMVVEVPAYVDRHGVRSLAQGHLPKQVAGLVKMLGEYQVLAADAAWKGNRMDAIRALASHPLVFSLEKAESIYDDMAHQLKVYLPERLLK